MKDEDRDWMLYHMIPEGKTVTIAALSDQSGFCREEVVASLKRMERNDLISVRDESVTLLTLSDMLMLNELRQMENMGVYLEGGVIKVRGGEQQ